MNFVKDTRYDKMIGSGGPYVHREMVYCQGGPVMIVLSDPRWTEGGAGWDDRRIALCTYAWWSLWPVVTAWKGRGVDCIYGALVEFSRAHPDFQVWMDGELIT